MTGRRNLILNGVTLPVKDTACAACRDYQNAEGCTRYYFRCPGPESGPDYCLQLVYTAENRLQDGFGTNRTVLLAP